MKILGIETSCDETSAAIIQTDRLDKPVKLLSNVVSSSMQLHGQTGGIIPEVAAREQIKYVLQVIDQALEKAFIAPNELEAIAITVGPGLIGSLLVGVETAKTLSMVWNKPLIPVNHLFGHIYANWIASENSSTTKKNIDQQEHTIPAFPCLALIVSGGHTDLVLLHDHKKIQWIAGTRDDAAGEAFDKIGRLLGLPYPAGPTIERLAKEGNSKRFRFPRPLLHEPTYDFSFSGLKTAVLREVQKIQKDNVILSSPTENEKSHEDTIEPNRISRFVRNDNNIDEQTVKDLAYATQDAIIDVLVTKTLKAAEEYNVKSIILSGGVAANGALREKFGHELHTKWSKINTGIFAPPKNLCTDNGAMIAAAGFYNYEEKSWEEISANPELYFD